tara:strand:+ start:8682 stop:9251 length:570 start_codon:yes stop_codon:yes gene_type:complete
MELVIDTETTGLTSLSFVTERNYQKWPRLVQIAWGYIEEDSLEIQNSTIIRPNGFNIPSDAIRIHGITNKQATEDGKDLKDLLNTLNHAMQRADTIIAHNLNFDLGILHSEAMRSGVPIEFPDKRKCTAFMGQAYMRKEHKMRLSEFPKLGELHKTLLGHVYEPHHDASSDVIACATVYNELKKLGYAR